MCLHEDPLQGYRIGWSVIGQLRLNSTARTSISSSGLAIFDFSLFSVIRDAKYWPNVVRLLITISNLECMSMVRVQSSTSKEWSLI